MFQFSRYTVILAFMDSLQGSDNMPRKSQYKSKPPLINMNKATRKCLFCGVEFISEWFGNRICSRCKNLSDFKTGLK